MGQLTTIEEIKVLYPDEWVLLGDPVMDNSKIEVLLGITLFHCKEKKEVFELDTFASLGLTKEKFKFRFTTF